MDHRSGDRVGGGRLLGLLVTFNRPVELAEQLRAIARQSRQMDELLIVDNGEGDSVADASVEHSSSAGSIEVLSTGSNLGPAGGIEQGMGVLLGRARAEDWIVLLDDDDPPKRDDFFELLFDFARDQQAMDPSVGMVGPTGTRFDRRRGRIRRLADAALSGPVDVDYVAGGQLPLISVAAIRSAGPFRGDLFFGFDDLEFGLRLRDAGWRIVVDGDLALWSRERAGRLGRGVGKARLTSGGVPWRRYYSVRNLIAIQRLHGSWWGALRVTLAVGIIKPLVMWMGSPRDGWVDVKLGTRAVVDAWTGRMGRSVEPPGQG